MPKNLVRRCGHIMALVCGLILSGCAIGNKHNYRDVIASLPVMASGSAVVATHDRRPYILSGAKPQNFVGLQRGGYGQPFDVSTGGETFASSFSAAVCNSLRKVGSGCEVAQTVPSEEPSQVIQKVLQRRPQRGLIFTVNEWKSDGMVRASLRYDVTLSVIDSGGVILASKQVQGNDVTADSIWVMSPPRAARKGALAALKTKMEELLGAPNVVAALNGTGAVVSVMENAQGGSSAQDRDRVNIDNRLVIPVPTPGRGACSVEQILQMKKIGLTDQQVKDSCG